MLLINRQSKDKNKLTKLFSALKILRSSDARVNRIKIILRCSEENIHREYLPNFLKCWKNKIWPKLLSQISWNPQLQLFWMDLGKRNKTKWTLNASMTSTYSLIKLLNSLLIYATNMMSRFFRRKKIKQKS